MSNSTYSYTYYSLIAVLCSCFLHCATSFILSGNNVRHIQIGSPSQVWRGQSQSHAYQERPRLHLSVSASALENEGNSSKENPSESKSKLVHMEAIASAGLSDEEIPLILSAVKVATDAYGIDLVTSNFRHDSHPAIPPSVPGAMGRCILLSLNNVNVADGWTDYDERLFPFKSAIAEQIDNLIMVGTGTGEEGGGQIQIQQPILVIVKPSCGNVMKDDDDDDISISSLLCSMVENEVTMHDLRLIMGGSGTDSLDQDDELHHQISTLPAPVEPDLHVEIDGAVVPDAYTSEGVWDTSSILVFDNFIDSELRERLLDVVNDRANEGEGEGYAFDDKLHGPDPRRWERGGLDDTPDDEVHAYEDGDTDAASSSSCWGLREEAIEQLCFEFHPAINEVEKKICALFSDFDVARLPESVLGPYITPLTANAPTFGDSFSYHIDADPNAAPPSPWTDIFGRYFNRVRGKPRFVSCLLYLNDEWDDELGAPTQFYDPPTEETFQVYPKPGRCVIMDQDVTHTVVAPNEKAGKRPRYSIVWKLILHPKHEKQSMQLLSGSEKIIRIGSANKK